MNDENPWEAESHQYGKYHKKARIADYKEEKIEEVISPVDTEAEETNGTLAENKESQLDNKELVETGEDIFLDGWSGSKIV